MATRAAICRIDEHLKLPVSYQARLSCDSKIGASALSCRRRVGFPFLLRTYFKGNYLLKSRLLLLLCLCIPGFAQTAAPPEAATVLEGIVTDSSGALIIGAKVSLVPPGGRSTYETVTDASGHYRIANPSAGTYTVRAEANGFRPAKSEVTVSAGRSNHGRSPTYGCREV